MLEILTHDNHGHYVWLVASASVPGEVHELRVDDQTGRIYCTCDGYWFHYGKHEPTILDPFRWCRHAKAALWPILAEREPPEVESGLY